MVPVMDRDTGPCEPHVTSNHADTPVALQVDTADHQHWPALELGRVQEAPPVGMTPGWGGVDDMEVRIGTSGWSYYSRLYDPDAWAERIAAARRWLADAGH